MSINTQLINAVIPLAIKKLMMNKMKQSTN
jgi:hypothetical protein